MTDYEWECRERFQQKERFMAYRKYRNLLNLPDDPSSLSYDFIEDDHNEKSKKYVFMTTVSIPVYDKRENAVSKTEIIKFYLLFQVWQKRAVADVAVLFQTNLLIINIL